MAKEYFLDVEGKRTVAKAFDHVPRVGEYVWLTNYGRVRAVRHAVVRVEWAIAQEESPAYFNRPKSVVIYLEADPKPHAGAGDDDGA